MCAGLIQSAKVNCGRNIVNLRLDSSTAYQVYLRNPLDLVAVALKFAPILKLAEDATIAQFQETIRGEFPEYSQDTGVIVEIKPDGLSQTMQDQHRFSNKTKSCTVILTKDQLALQTTDHLNRKATLGRFDLALRALRDLSGDSIAPERFGVRYINNIDKDKIGDDLKDTVSWSDLVQGEFLSIPGQQAGGDDTRYFCEINSAMPDGRLITRYGLLPAQSSRVPQVMFRFDCDRFIDSGIDLDGLGELSNNFVSDIYAEFVKIRGPALIKWMNTAEHEKVLQ